MYFISITCGVIKHANEIMMASKQSASVKKGDYKRYLAQSSFNLYPHKLSVMAIQAKRKKKVKKPPPRRAPGHHKLDTKR